MAVHTIHSILHRNHILDGGLDIHDIIVGIDLCGIVLAEDITTGTANGIHAQFVDAILQSCDGLVDVTLLSCVLSGECSGIVASECVARAFPSCEGHDGVALEIGALSKVSVFHEWSDFRAWSVALFHGSYPQFFHVVRLFEDFIAIQASCLVDVIEGAVGERVAWLLATSEIGHESVQCLARLECVAANVFLDFIGCLLVGCIGLHTFSDTVLQRTYQAVVLSESHHVLAFREIQRLDLVFIEQALLCNHIEVELQRLVAELVTQFLEIFLRAECHFSHLHLCAIESFGNFDEEVFVLLLHRFCEGEVNGLFVFCWQHIIAHCLVAVHQFPSLGIACGKGILSEVSAIDFPVRPVASIVSFRVVARREREEERLDGFYGFEDDVGSPVRDVSSPLGVRVAVHQFGPVLVAVPCSVACDDHEATLGESRDVVFPEVYLVGQLGGARLTVVHDVSIGTQGEGLAWSSFRVVVEVGCHRGIGGAQIVEVFVDDVLDVGLVFCIALSRLLDAPLECGQRVAQCGQIGNCGALEHALE